MLSAMSPCFGLLCLLLQQLCAEGSRRLVRSRRPVPPGTERHVDLAAAFPGHPTFEWFCKLMLPSCQVCDRADGHGEYGHGEYAPTDRFGDLFGCISWEKYELTDAGLC